MRWLDRITDSMDMLPLQLHRVSGRLKWGPAQKTPTSAGSPRFLGFISLLLNPAPLPQIMVKSASVTPGWCNATLECTASGDTGPEGDLGEHGPSQGAENNAGSILTLLDPDSEPAPESTKCQLDLCGQQSGGSKNCHLRPGRSLSLCFLARDQS